jgi:hypothetical protein
VSCCSLAGQAQLFGPGPVVVSQKVMCARYADSYRIRHRMTDRLGVPQEHVHLPPTYPHLPARRG